MRGVVLGHFLWALVQTYANAPILGALGCTLKCSDTTPTIATTVKHNQGWCGLSIHPELRDVASTYHGFLLGVIPFQAHPNFVRILDSPVSNGGRGLKTLCFGASTLAVYLF